MDCGIDLEQRNWGGETAWDTVSRKLLTDDSGDLEDREIDAVEIQTMTSGLRSRLNLSVRCRLFTQLRVPFRYGTLTKRDESLSRYWATKDLQLHSTAVAMNSKCLSFMFPKCSRGSFHAHWERQIRSMEYRYSCDSKSYSAKIAWYSLQVQSRDSEKLNHRQASSENCIVFAPIRHSP
jgi:hypothetical protein